MINFPFTIWAMPDYQLQIHYRIYKFESSIARSVRSNDITYDIGETYLNYRSRVRLLLKKYNKGNCVEIGSALAELKEQLSVMKDSYKKLASVNVRHRQQFKQCLLDIHCITNFQTLKSAMIITQFRTKNFNHSYA